MATKCSQGAGKLCVKVSGGSCLGEDAFEVHVAAQSPYLDEDCLTALNRTVEKSPVKVPSKVCSSESYWRSLK